MHQQDSNPANLQTAAGYPVSYNDATPYSTTATNATSGYAPQAPTQPNKVEWSTGLCDCGSDCGNFCLTWFFPCVTFGRVAEILDKGSPSCCASGVVYTLIWLVFGCGSPYSCSYRSKMRQQYGLEGNGCTDCLIHCCCEACALSQEYRELQNRGFDMTAGWNGDVEQRSREVAMSVTAPSAKQGMSR